ncbi:MAG: frmA [Ilumatobacteraceae bacterium]|nr:frmA [Ilumatobacteraceae bacterium]
MRAAVLSTQPGRTEVEELRIDAPMRNEVVVRVEAAGLCHSDLHFMEAKFRTPLPCVLGHESAGVVEAVGEDVTYVAVGDHVVCCTSVFCGRCRQCLSGHPYRCTDTAATERPAGAPPRLARQDGSTVEQFSRLGGFAERMLLHENAVVKIRDDIPPEVAAILGCAVLTGTGAVFRSAGVEPGSRTCVIGAGGIGLAAIQAARIAGAEMVVAVDVSDEKLQLASRLGATHTVNAGAVDDVVREVKRITNGGADYSFEAIGLKATAEQAFRLLDIGGTATVIGMVPSNQPIEVRGVDLLFERTLQGSMMGSNQFRIDIPRLVSLYLDGRLHLDEMISDRIELDQINESYDELRRGAVTRAVVKF